MAENFNNIISHYGFSRKYLCLLQLYPHRLSKIVKILQCNQRNYKKWKNGKGMVEEVQKESIKCLSKKKEFLSRVKPFPYDIIINAWSNRIKSCIFPQQPVEQDNASAFREKIASLWDGFMFYQQIQDKRMFEKKYWVNVEPFKYYIVIGQLS